MSSFIPSDGEMRKVLIQRIDEYRQSVGIVVGTVEPTDRRFLAYGVPPRATSAR